MRLGQRALEENEHALQKLVAAVEHEKNDLRLRNSLEHKVGAVWRWLQLLKFVDARREGGGLRRLDQSVPGERTNAPTRRDGFDLCGAGRARAARPIRREKRLLRVAQVANEKVIGVGRAACGARVLCTHAREKACARIVAGEGHLDRREARHEAQATLVSRKQNCREEVELCEAARVRNVAAVPTEEAGEVQAQCKTRQRVSEANAPLEVTGDALVVRLGIDQLAHHSRRADHGRACLRVGQNKPLEQTGGGGDSHSRAARGGPKNRNRQLFPHLQLCVGVGLACCPIRSEAAGVAATIIEKKDEAPQLGQREVGVARL